MDHSALLAVQQKNRGWKGFVSPKPNCTIAGLVVSLKPIQDLFGVKQVVMTSLQAMSGAGRTPGLSAMDMTENIVPYIPGEEPKVETEPQKILSESPCLQYKVWLQNAGEWKVTVRALPTFSVATGQPQRYAITLDDAPLQIVSLPLSLDERNRQWQENVLRNAALTTSTHALPWPGAHSLKIWMVDPGIVLDTIAAQTGPEQGWGYFWPAETRPSPELSR